jgi:uncharacterized membrane protein
MMLLFWLPLLLLCPLAMYLMMRFGTGMGHHDMSQAGPEQAPLVTRPDPIEIARQRLARGEITTSEFDEIRRVLS